MTQQAEAKPTDQRSIDTDVAVISVFEDNNL